MTRWSDQVTRYTWSDDQVSGQTSDQRTVIAVPKTHPGVAFLGSGGCSCLGLNCLFYKRFGSELSFLQTFWV